MRSSRVCRIRLSEMLWRHPFSVMNLTVFFGERTAAEKKLSWQNKIRAQLHKPKLSRRGKRKGRQGRKTSLRYFQSREKALILSVLSVYLLRGQWDLLQPKMQHLTACLLLGRRDTKIQNHCKTMDRSSCVATFLKSSDRKDSLTELHFPTLTMCLPSKGSSSGWAYGNTHTYILLYCRTWLTSTRRELGRKQE